jgi:hypothetical protein
MAAHFSSAASCGLRASDLCLPLIVHMHGGFQHATRLFAVDVVLVRQALRRAAANILMAETAFHFIQHAFAQRAVGQAQLFNRQRIKYAAENSQTRSKTALRSSEDPAG